MISRWGSGSCTTTFVKSCASFPSRMLTPQTTGHTPGRGTSIEKSYFEFTRGRFVWNEKSEMAKRHVELDLDELAAVAVTAIQSDSCVQIEKFPDGMHNKAYCMTMNDGRKVVAKVPNPNAGLAHYTTASEVATMNFARELLSTPVPKVHAWCSKAAETPVRSEYIIMDLVEGVQLAEVWPTMDIKSRFEVVKSIYSLQKAWASISFNKYGSLYYAKDLSEDDKASSRCFDKDGKDLAIMEYGIGQSTSRDMSDEGRDIVDFDRGPWNSLEARQLAVGDRESACTRKLAELPRSPVTLCGPGTYVPTREKKLEAIDCYLAIAKWLLPTDETICIPHLGHGDLHAENIYVDPASPTRLTGIIDWQSTEIAPLFALARQPYLLDHGGSSPRGLERPGLPRDFATLDEEKQQLVRAAYYNKSLEALYRTLVNKKEPRLYRAMEFRDTAAFNLMLLAQNLLVDGEATMLAQIAALQETWHELPKIASGVPPVDFPCHFSAQRRLEIETDVEGASRGIQAMQGIRDSMGDLFPEQGLVLPEQYDEARQALRQIKEQVARHFAQNTAEEDEWRRAWPFCEVE